MGHGVVHIDLPEACKPRVIFANQPPSSSDPLACASNFMVARAAFDMSVSFWPVAQIELRQEAWE
jgi:hypothetical protein